MSSRTSVPALPQSIGPSGGAQAAQPDAVDDERVDVRPRRPRRRARARPPSVDSVSPERPKPRDARLALARARRSGRARCEIDLSPGTPMCPSMRGGRLNPHRAPPRRRRCSPGLEQLRGAPRLAPRRVTSSVSVPPRSGEMWSSSKSSMLIRAAPKRLGDLGEHVRPVGDVDAGRAGARRHRA